MALVGLSIGQGRAAYATRNGRLSDLTPIIELHIDTVAP